MSRANGSATADMIQAEGRRCDLNAERGVLGALIQSGSEYAGLPADIAGVLTGPGDFFEPRHQMLYRKIQQLAAEGHEITAHGLLMSLSGVELAQTDNGTYIGACVSAASPLQGTYYARVVRDYAAWRSAQEWIAGAAMRLRDAPVVDIAELLSRVQEEIAELQVGPSQTNMKDFDEVAREAMDEMDAIQARLGQEPQGALTGWPDIDALLHGLRAGQLVVVAGRPGIGKSVTGRQIAQYVAVAQRKHALLFSLEMSRVEVGMALLSAGAKIPLDTLRSGNLSEEDWYAAAKYIGSTESAPLYVDDTPGATMDHFEREIRRHIARHGPLGLVVIDHAGLIEGGSERANRSEVVSSFVRRCKLLAKKYGVPIILLAQLNRGPTQRTDKVPQLSDLKESGGIEEHADVVILLHREDYYDEESPRAGEVDFIIAKHRGGPTGTKHLASQLHLQRFVSMAMPSEN